MVRIATCQLTPASNAKVRKIQIKTILMNAEADHIDIRLDQLLQEKRRRVYGNFPLTQEIAKLST